MSLVGQTVTWATRGVSRQGVVVADEPPGYQHSEHLLPDRVRFGSKSFRLGEGWPDGLVVEVTDDEGMVRYYAPRRRWLGPPEERER